MTQPSAMFRAYSIERRDRAPLIETEDFRDESARRFWDDFSPPYFGFKPGPEDTYHWTSESFALAAVKRYHDYWINRISNADPAHSKWSGYASIYFSDSNADGRQQSTETCRVSGKVDALRLPKEAYFTYQVMQIGAAGDSYPRALDLPRGDEEDRLCHREHFVRRTCSQRQIAGRLLHADRWIRIRISRMSRSNPGH